MLMQCVQKNISYKTMAIPINYDHSFRNKFAAKIRKHFSSDLSNVSTLPCETYKVPSRMCYHGVVKERNCRIYSTLTVASKFARFESRWLLITDYTACGILQEEVFKICITDLDELKQQLRTEWATLVDHIAAAIRQLQISDWRFVHVLSQYSHTL